MKVPLVFMGTPEFAVPSLQRLVVDGYHISAVYTQPDRPAGRGRRLTPPPVKVAALGLGLAVRQPPNLRSQEAVAELAALKPEVIVVCAFGQILRPPVLDIPPRGVINVHPSLLPRWRGASPIPAAILAGDRETGVTIILMDAGMDSGPVLSQIPEAISDDDSTASLLARLAEAAAELVAETLPRWLSGEIEPAPQNDSQATTCPLLRKEDGAIDWRLSATDIWRRVRAYNPWPGAYTNLDGKLLHIWRAWPLDVESHADAGAVVELDPQWRAQMRTDTEAGAGFAVKTGGGILVPIEVQRSGRRTLSAQEFQRGMRGLIGRRFDSGE